MLVVLAVTDKRNGPPPVGMVPLVIFIVILGIGAAFGMQTGEMLVLGLVASKETLCLYLLTALLHRH